MTKIMPALASSVLIFLAGLQPGIANAQDQPIKRTELLRTDLADIAGKETVIYIADVVPGGEGGRHTHYGDEFVYILEGTSLFNPMGKRRSRLSRARPRIWRRVMVSTRQKMGAQASPPRFWFSWW